MWPSTVRGDSVSRWAISGVLSPAATRLAISRSRALSGSGWAATTRAGVWIPPQALAMRSALAAASVAWRRSSRVRNISAAHAAAPRPPPRRCPSSGPRRRTAPSPACTPRFCGRRDCRATLAAELGLLAQFRAARSAQKGCHAVMSRGQPTVVHVTIVSPLASQHVPYRTGDHSGPQPGRYPTGSRPYPTPGAVQFEDGGFMKMSLSVTDRSLRSRIMSTSWP